MTNEKLFYENIEALKHIENIINILENIGFVCEPGIAKGEHDLSKEIYSTYDIVADTVMNLLNLDDVDCNSKEKIYDMIISNTKSTNSEFLEEVWNNYGIK